MKKHRGGTYRPDPTRFHLEKRGRIRLEGLGKIQTPRDFISSAGEIWENLEKSGKIGKSGEIWENLEKFKHI